jgi:hypothetical protein
MIVEKTAGLPNFAENGNDNPGQTTYLPITTDIGKNDHGTEKADHPPLRLICAPLLGSETNHTETYAKYIF